MSECSCSCRWGRSGGGEDRKPVLPGSRRSPSCPRGSPRTGSGSGGGPATPRSLPRVLRARAASCAAPLSALRVACRKRDGGRHPHVLLHNLAVGGVMRRLPARLRPDPLQTLGLVLIGAALARVYRLRTPNLPVIFDETFYVNATRIILGMKVHPGLPYSGARPGFDPNEEHPVLGKLLIAG